MSEQPMNLPEVFVTLAQRPGWCPRCGTRILRGEPIVKVEGSWCHADTCGYEVEPVEEAA